MGARGVRVLSARLAVRAQRVELERDVAAALSNEFGVEVITESDFPDDPPLQGKISPRFLKSAQALPLEETEDRLRVAVADPDDGHLADRGRGFDGEDLHCRTMFMTSFFRANMVISPTTASPT